MKRVWTLIGIASIDGLIVRIKWIVKGKKRSI